MKRSRAFGGLLFVIALLAASLLGGIANAGGTGSIGDDFANDGAPLPGFQKPGQGGTLAQNDPKIQAGCDTLDTATQTKASIIYNCFPSTDITNWSLETLDASQVPTNSNTMGTKPASGLFLHGRWQVSGLIPHESNNIASIAQEFAAHKTTGVSYYINFQNNNTQNQRQVVGWNEDCQFYSHLGPYLTGDSRVLGLIYSVQLQAASDPGASPVLKTSFGFTTYDPIASSYAVYPAQPPLTQLQSRCEGSPRKLAPLKDDPGTAGATWVVTGNTLDVYIPARYHFYGLPPSYMPYDYDIVRANDQVTSVTAMTYANVNIATVGPFNAANKELVPETGVTLIVRKDWSPWGGWETGYATRPSWVATPRCPQYAPGTPVGADGVDKETQVNALFAAPLATNGLSIYDSTGLPGLTGAGQTHNGPKDCTVRTPTARYYTGQGAGPFTA